MKEYLLRFFGWTFGFVFALSFLPTEIHAALPERFLKGVEHAFRGQCQNVPVEWNSQAFQDHDIDYLKQQGVDFATMHLSGPAAWNEIAAANPHQNGQDPENYANPFYDFRFLDSAVAKLNDAGIAPVMNVWGTPIWAQTPPPTDEYAPGCFDFLDYGGNPPQNLSELGYFMKAVATRYNGTHSNLNPLQVEMEEFITQGDKYFRRVSPDSGITFPSVWQTGTLQSLWGNTNSNDPAFPRPPTTGINIHAYFKKGTIYAESVEAGTRFWYRESSDGKTWPNTWYTDTYAGVWNATTSNNSNYPHPNTMSPIDAHTFTLDDSITGTVLTESVIQGDRYWYRIYNQSTNQWPTVWYTDTLSSAWGNDVNAPPNSGLTDFVFRYFGDRLAQAVIKGTSFWYRERSKIDNSWPTTWQQYSVSSSWKGINAPPIQTPDSWTFIARPSGKTLPTFRMDHYMIYAEPNLYPFWQGTQQQFVTMNNAAYDKIKQANPQSQMWGANLANCCDLRALDTLVLYGSLGLKMDVLGIRGYPDGNPPNGSPTQQQPRNDRDFLTNTLHRLFDTLNTIPNNPSLPIQYKDLRVIVTESGYQLTGLSAVTEQQQADYLRGNLDFASAHYPRMMGWTNFLIYEYADFDTGFLAKCTSGSPGCDRFGYRRRVGFDMFKNYVYTPLPSPTTSPSYTVAQLKTALSNYVTAADSTYRPVDGKINILDVGYMIKWIAP